MGRDVEVVGSVARSKLNGIKRSRVVFVLTKTDINSAWSVSMGQLLKEPIMPLHLVFTQDSLRFLSKYTRQLRTLSNRINPFSADLALLLVVAALSLMQFSMRYEMTVLLLVYGPMQLLRSIPYDIRAFILTHSRISLLILRLTSQPRALSEYP